VPVQQPGWLVTAGECCEKGSTMKRAFIGISLAALLICFVLELAGCSMEQMGETTAEGHRRHVRNLRLNKQGMTEDIDALLLLDKPSTLIERTIP